MRLIILAAGDSFELDGFNKLLIKNPLTGKSILQGYADVFNVDKITLVIGYRGMEVMHEYPEYEYIYNQKWQTTGSGYSLSLALTEEPSIIIESDFFIDYSLKAELNSLGNYVVIKQSESKSLNSFKAKIKDGGVFGVYKGKSQNQDPTLISLFKESNDEVLRQWKKNGIENPHLYIGQTYPYESNRIPYFVVDNKSIYEINTINDYISYVEKIRK